MSQLEKEGERKKINGRRRKGGGGREGGREDSEIFRVLLGRWGRGGGGGGGFSSLNRRRYRSDLHTRARTERNRHRGRIEQIVSIFACGQTPAEEGGSERPTQVHTKRAF